MVYCKCDDCQRKRGRAIADAYAKIKPVPGTPTTEQRDKAAQIEASRCPRCGNKGVVVRLLYSNMPCPNCSPTPTTQPHKSDAAKLDELEAQHG